MIQASAMDGEKPAGISGIDLASATLVRNRRNPSTLLFHDQLSTAIAPDSSRGIRRKCPIIEFGACCWLFPTAAGAGNA